MELSFYKNKKVLVTGHTGFKGAWLSRVLLDAGAVVSGFALKPPTNPSLFKLLKLEKNMLSITGDIRGLAAVKNALKKAKPEIVIHMAAQPLVRESYKAPVYTYETNVIGTVNLLEACRNTKSARSIVNVTTDKVYENMEIDRGYREDEKLSGYDPYSNSKSCSEMVTYSYRNSFFCKNDSPAVSTARSGNVIGGGDFAQDRIVPDFVRAMSAGKDACLRNPQATRPYQHVLDCLSGYLLLAQKQYDKKLCGAYNFGPDEKDAVDNAVLMDLFCKAWGGAKCVHKNDGGPHEAHFLKLNCAKAKKVLGWKPRIHLKKAVELTVQWSKAYILGADFTGCMDSQIKEHFTW